MGLPKGRTNNKEGRPPGSENKLSGELRDRIKNFLDCNFEIVETDFKSLEPEKRIILFEKYLKFVLPQLQSTDINLDIEKLSDAELDLIINRLLSRQ